MFGNKPNTPRIACHHRKNGRIYPFERLITRGELWAHRCLSCCVVDSVSLALIDYSSSKGYRAQHNHHGLQLQQSRIRCSSTIPCAADRSDARPNAYEPRSERPLPDASRLRPGSHVPAWLSDTATTSTAHGFATAISRCTRPTTPSSFTKLKCSANSGSHYGSGPCRPQLFVRLKVHRTFSHTTSVHISEPSGIRNERTLPTNLLLS